MLRLFKAGTTILCHSSKRLYYAPQACFASGKMDYYKILGVDQKADQKQIKAAFYKLAKQYHPDVNKGTEEKFKQINEAYEVLSDEGKRRAYDDSLKYGGGAEDFNASQSYYGGRRAGGYQQQQNQYYQQQQQQQGPFQQTFYYTYTDKDGRKRTYSKTKYSNANEDFEEFYNQFFKNFGGNFTSEDFRRKVYEDIKRQQQVI